MEGVAQVPRAADRDNRAPEILFEGGPPFRLEQLLHLSKPGESRALRRATFLALASWGPLAALAAAQTLRTGDDSARVFFTDIAIYARFLVAIPFLIFAEQDCIPRLGKVAHQFVAGGLVTDEVRPAFDNAILSTRRLLDSRVGEVLAVVLAYTVVASALAFVPIEMFPAWHQSTVNGVVGIGLAGWWHKLVSVPIFLILLFGWFYRIILWGRFLWIMSRLKLRLIPGHPDQCGGLKFVSTSLRGFRLLAFALGAGFAGLAANQVILNQLTLLGARNLAIAVVVLVLIISAGPLTPFIRPLRAAKKRGTFLYGALAGQVGWQFERTWIESKRTFDHQALEVPDFSATTDLFGVVANVYDMKEFPFGLKNLANLVVATLLPFIPIALLKIPIKEVLQDLAKLLL
jgi:hypothetical protein